MDIEKFVKKYSVERRNTDSLKWDALEEKFGNSNLLALWVADMEFKTPECVRKTLKNRVEHGVFGYTKLSESYYTEYIKWHKERHNYTIEKEWIRFAPGIVQAILWILHAYTKEDDSVVIMPPVYYPFSLMIKNSKRKLVEANLLEKNGKFKIDFETFEKVIKENNVKLYIHCSPHNPIGRVWTLEEQMRVFEICEKYNVLVLSDEIHQDFVYKPHKQIATLSLENGKYIDRLIVANSGSKSFNLASLCHSSIIIADETLRKRFDDFGKKYLAVESSYLGQIALESAYREGKEWLENLKEVIEYNYKMLYNEFKKYLPTVTVYPLEGTYLAFVNLKSILNGRTIKEFIQDECSLAIDYGEWFGKNYKEYIRINLATTPENIKEAISRIIERA
ncbi:MULTISPECIES: MalY/PatB family protein [Gemella]|uniref:MalY/PatB family protein n=1 Tax=Gemella TaxID=1378 RepID=UPI00076800F0|nr:MULTISPECIES: MalY/PatB family protein [Gemella]AME09496.1 aminotransferase [Gemella sp. oral taxon 928]AXI27136.1 pyridoxal phosphate-dependent aminotransferase [Gemella sp. ND 6198]